MSSSSKSADDSMSMIWTQKNQKGKQGPAAGAQNSRVRKLGELDCGHSRDVNAAMQREDAEGRGLHLDDETRRDAAPMPKIEPPPPRKMRMKPSKRLPKQSSRHQPEEAAAEEESEMGAGVTHGGLVFGQHTEAQQEHDEDEPEYAAEQTPAQLYAAAFEARTSPKGRRTAPRGTRATEDAESAVTFACEAPATARGTPAALPQHESQVGEGSAITFAHLVSAQNGRVLHDMNVRGRPKADPSSPGQRARAPAPHQAEFAGAFLTDDADDAPNGATDPGGDDDDVFTTIALSNKPAPATRLGGGNTRDNKRWESAKQSSGPFRRI
jgi:hypothetical protein